MKTSKNNIKFFQYLIGEHQGEVTALECIDDTMPELGIFYCFNDGFRCNAELIGELGDTNAFNNGCVLAHIPSMNNKWEFNIKEIGPQEKKDTNNDGVSVIGADPYFFGKDGKSLASTKKQVTAIPPYVGIISEKEKDLSSYCLSSENADLNDCSQEIPESQDEVIITANSIANQFEKKTITPAEALQFVNSVDASSFNSFQMPEPKIIIEGYEFTKELYEEFLEYCKQKRETEEEKTEEEHSPIKILLDKTKVKSAVIDTKLTMQLPPVQLYNIVQELYGEDGANELVYRIVENVTCEKLKSAIAESIIDFYSKPSAVPVE